MVDCAVRVDKCINFEPTTTETIECFGCREYQFPHRGTNRSHPQQQGVYIYR